MKTFRVTATVSDSDGGFIEVITRVARNAAVAMALVMELPDVMSIISVMEV